MYAKFGGLGIHNCLLHARVVKLRAETKNVNELLAFRAIATTAQARSLMVRLSLQLHAFSPASIDYGRGNKFHRDVISCKLARRCVRRGQQQRWSPAHVGVVTRSV